MAKETPRKRASDITKGDAIEIDGSVRTVEGVTLQPTCIEVAYRDDEGRLCTLQAHPQGWCKSPSAAKKKPAKKKPAKKKPAKKKPAKKRKR